MFQSEHIVIMFQPEHIAEMFQPEHIVEVFRLEHSSAFVAVRDGVSGLEAACLPL
jgi:hypothetical protein